MSIVSLFVSIELASVFHILIEVSIFTSILDALTIVLDRFNITLDQPTEIGYIDADNINTEEL